MDLISIIAIIVIISKILNKAGNAASKVEQYGQPKNVWGQMTGQKQRTTSSLNQSTQWQQAARENIEKARKRAEQKFREMESEVVGDLHKKNTYQMPKQNVRTTPAQEQLRMQQSTQRNAAYQHSVHHRQQENRSAVQQVYAGRAEARNTSILERAKLNADEDKMDVTLMTMEAEHNHSERIAPAEHYHPEDILSENMLGTVEDLMVKGFDGNLCFERDFLGEALDMINRFTISTDIPEPSVDDVA